ncbi:MAG: leucine-rich repeat domain-containing protein [Oscillospiraceae bacterium]|nr:leucine-rich repeat domain-containing protein [Oscillospiraceae bacterium]MDD6145808.1 leucine-rich repeat domain-containing protein [Oscillospiraceae bacterium]
MKRTLLKVCIPVVLICVLAFSFSFAFAPTASAVDVLTYEVINGAARITDCQEDFEGELVIPNTLGGAPVKTIGDSAFEGIAEMTAVTIPASVTAIGANAFSGCIGLTELTIPDSVTSVGAGAFSSCASLASFTFGKGMTAVSYGMFEGCSALSDIKLPDSVTAIGDYAFWGCIELKSLTLHSGITAIGSYAFYDCGKLETIVVPEKINAIGDGTFGECVSLKKVSLQENIESIGLGAFYNCKALETVYYTGSVTRWNQIAVESDNDKLYDCAISFAHSHDNDVQVIKEADCTNTGIAVFTCKECGYVRKGTLEAKGHTSVDIPAVAATCTETGKTTGRKCSVCGVILMAQQDIPAKGHRTVNDQAVKATCTSTGLTSGSHCSACGTVFKAQTVIDKLPHSYTYQITKATFTTNGKKISTCSVCNEVTTKVLYNVSVVNLSKTSYVYDGNPATPTVTVKNSNGETLKEDVDYRLTYESNRINPGVYSVKVQLIGDYNGSKKLTYNILPTKTTKITGNCAISAITYIWNKVPGATGYQVYLYNTTTKKYEKLAVVTTNSYKLTKAYGKPLPEGKSYKIAVKAYTKDEGVTLWSPYYTAQTLSTKPGKPTLAVTAGSGKATLKWSREACGGYLIYMATSQNGEYKKVATISSRDQLTYTKTGLTKGKTYYFKVIPYKVVAGYTIYGSYSTAKAVKIK